MSRRSHPLLIAIAAITAVSTPAVAHAQGYNATVQNTPGLLAYYTFTAAAQANSVVNGYTGTLMNGASVGGPGSGPPVSDPSSSALILANGAGGTQFATAGGSKPLMGQIGTSGSIVAWINLASLPSTQGRIFSIAGESAGGDDFDFQINGDNRLAFYTDGGSATVSASAFGASTLNQWLFIAGTFSSGMDRSVYVDGSLMGTSTPGGHSDAGSPFYVGQSNVFGGSYFDGAISDVAVFNTDLTAAQIQAIYQSRLVPVGGGGMSNVPEPSTWMLAAVGLVGIGTLARRRPRVS